MSDGRRYDSIDLRLASPLIIARVLTLGPMIFRNPSPFRDDRTVLVMCASVVPEGTE